MKVSIGSKIVRGPWGGGNLFAINLSNYLLSQGHSVIYDLTDPDIDLILLTDPRSRGESSSGKSRGFLSNLPNLSGFGRIALRKTPTKSPTGLDLNPTFEESAKETKQQRELKKLRVE